MPSQSRNHILAGCGTHHVGIQTRDWDASLRLYRDVLGMSIVTEFGTPERKIVLLDIGDGSHIELFQPTATSPKPGDSAALDPVSHFALTVADTRAAIEHVRASGYRITVEPKDIDLNGLRATNGRFEGPSGESVEFFQRRP